MKGKTYTIKGCLDSLSKKSGVEIDSKHHLIRISKHSTNLGNKSWGKLDFLNKNSDYYIMSANH